MIENIFDPYKKRYCGSCGAILKMENYARYFNTDTGEDYYHYRFTCPRWRWWKFWEYHARWRCDESGSSYRYLNDEMLKEA